MKIAVLLSGGVDSSLTLQLLKNQGNDLTAFYLKIWLEDELAFLGQCPWEEDLKFARETCEQLDVPLKIISLQREYYQRVVQYTIKELKSGYTPSPDIFCNERIKFGVFFDKIDASYQKVASGHYARIVQEGENYLLKTCPDRVKDQTYFLAHMHKNQLARALFPLGELTKKEVRSLAEQYQLPACRRKDSQGICFLGKIKFNDFVQYHLGKQAGNIIEKETGKILGQHQGFWFHTVGQRKGLRLSGGPWYVVGKDMDQNIVYVSHKEYLEKQSQNTFIAGDFHWITSPETEHLQVKIRHGPKFYDCKLDIENAVQGKPAQVTLVEKDPGIAPGQFAIFYHEDNCLGCAKIQRTTEETINKDDKVGK